MFTRSRTGSGAPHMQIVFLSCLWWLCSCRPSDPSAHTAPPHIHTHTAYTMATFLCFPSPVLRLSSLSPRLSLTCLFSQDFTPPNTQNNNKKKNLSKCIAKIKTFLFTKLQSCQLNLINNSNIYPPHQQRHHAWGIFN